MTQKDLLKFCIFYKEGEVSPRNTLVEKERAIWEAEKTAMSDADALIMFNYNIERAFRQRVIDICIRLNPANYMDLVGLYQTMIPTFKPATKKTEKDCLKFCTYYNGSEVVPMSLSEDERCIWMAEKMACDVFVVKYYEFENPEKSFKEYVCAYIQKWDMGWSTTLKLYANASPRYIEKFL